MEIYGAKSMSNGRPNFDGANGASSSPNGMMFISLDWFGVSWDLFFPPSGFSPVGPFTTTEETGDLMEAFDDDGSISFVAPQAGHFSESMVLSISKPHTLQIKGVPL